LHNETPKTPNKTRKPQQIYTEKLTNWRNKQTGMNKLNLISIFVIWEQFGNKGGVNDMNWFKAELDFDFKPHGRTCFRFWMKKLDFEWISILRWGTQDLEWISISILNWAWNEDEERMNKTGSKRTNNLFDFGFADEEERRNNFSNLVGTNKTEQMK